ncbi:MAG: hypothetical protein JW749_07855 [Sedimentisphaerales bacterium]|nr:hypothetical protein [Sedimentisphaerales bacterium]
MLTGKYVIILLLWLVLAGPVSAQETGNVAQNEPNVPSPEQLRPTATGTPKPPEKLFSPSVSQLFYGIGHELSHDNDSSESKVQQTIVFLDAANELDFSSELVPADLLTIASRPGHTRNLYMLYNLLIKYVSKNSNSLVATNAIRFLLGQLDYREQKEKMISRLLLDLGDSNLYIKSELLTTYGLLYAEKADDVNAAKLMAMAYNANTYNHLAFEKLTELVPEQISPVLNLQYLRLNLRLNPIDLETALAFAQYAQRVQLYEVAAGSYEYAADLFRFLYPNQKLPAGIYLDWMTCCYNVPRYRNRCLQLAERFRKEGRFDLQIEALASKAAEKIGDTERARQLLKDAERQALELLEKPGSTVDYKTLAWFYCFVSPDPNRAVDFANKAFSNEPNSPTSAALLACALVDNNQLDQAKPLVENYPQTQIATFVSAKLNLAAGNKQQCLDSLRSAIDRDPGSIVAGEALSLLAGLDADYIPIFDTTLMMNTLQQQIGKQLIPQFVAPEQMLSFVLNVRGTRFIYGSDFAGVISITNNWFEPLVISDIGFCRGSIVIDAEVTGDLNARFDKLISVTTKPSTPIAPGQSTLVPVRLFSGPLRAFLVNHPQASLNIKFTAYLDPVIFPDTNTISCLIPGIKPGIVEIERPRVEITPDFLQNRFESLARGKQGPRIKAAQLFTGLLAESRENPSYKHVRADWMYPMLKSGLAQSLTDADWVVRVHTLAAMADLPLDYELTGAASAGLNDRHWPARMTALWLLASKQGYSFQKVLDHSAQHDESVFVQSMAVALGAKKPQQTRPVEQSILDILGQEPNASDRPFLTP